MFCARPLRSTPQTGDTHARLSNIQPAVTRSLSLACLPIKCSPLFHTHKHTHPIGKAPSDESKAIQQPTQTATRGSIMILDETPNHAKPPDFTQILDSTRFQRPASVDNANNTNESFCRLIIVRPIISINQKSIKTNSCSGGTRERIGALERARSLTRREDLIN